MIDWNRIDGRIALDDAFRVIGHVAKEGETLGANGHYVLKRESDGAHFTLQATDPHNFHSKENHR